MAILDKIHDTNPVSLVRKLRDGWNVLIDDYMSRRLTAGPGIRLTREPAGTVISSTARGGGGVGGAAGYVGPFAVEATTKNGNTITEIKIYNSADPDSGICGWSDVVSPIQNTTLQGSFTESFIVVLNLVYENNKYSCHFSAEPWHNIKSSERIWPIAAVQSGNLVQMWTGGMIYWRSRFLVSFGRGDAG